MKPYRPVLRLLATVVASTGLAVVAVAAPEQPRALNRDLLERILHQSSIERTMPDPSWSAYVADVSRHVGNLLARWLERTGLPADNVLRAVGWIAIVAVLLVLLVAAGDLLSRNRARPVPSSGGSPAGRAAPPAPAAPADPWAVYRRRFESGRLREALEALWWAVVGVYAEGRPTRSWTTGDLLRVASRPSLQPLLATLDRLRFGPDAAAPEEVARLARALEESTT